MQGARFLGSFDDRIAAELPEGYVVGIRKGNGSMQDGAAITGVFRRIGEQQWSDESGNTIAVWVEDFDLDRAGLRNWSTGVE